MQQTRSSRSSLSIAKKRVNGTVVANKTVPKNQQNAFRPDSQFLKTQLPSVIQLIQDVVNLKVNTINSSHGPTYFTQTTIFGKNLPMLVDSGSQVNIVSVHDVHPDVLKGLAPSTVNITAYDGSPINIRGVFLTDIQVGEIRLERTPIYVINEPFKPVLGTPALDKLVIDFPNKSLKLNGKTAIITKSSEQVEIRNIHLKRQSQKPISKQLFQLYSAHDVTLPAFSETILPVTIKNDFCSNGLFTTEPITSELPASVLIGKSASHLSRFRRSTCIRICNTSKEPLQIAYRQPIVKVTEVLRINAISSNTKLTDVLNDVQIGTSDPIHREKIVNLITTYKDVFATDDQPLHQATDIEFDVNTGSAPPVAQQKYRTPYFLRDEMKRIIDHNVDTGLMEPCSSPWAAPVLLVKKANGKYRLVCDYRKLNSITVADHYPLPNIQEIVNELSESTIFTSTDLHSGFHQVKTTDEAKKKLAVVTEFGQYSWSRMPMGAKNCPSVFQRVMDKCFRSMPTSSLVIYLDDLLLHTKDMPTHLLKLEEMLMLLQKNGLQLRASKTIFAAQEASFCGYQISNGTKRPNPKKVEAVRNLGTPTCKKSVQQLFGLLNYHRFFIKNFASKSAPITQTYSGNKRFKWTQEASAALNKLKSEICDAALELTIPNIQTAKFVLETDACNSGYGAVLNFCQSSKLHDQHSAECLRPIEYMSAQFTPAQHNYYIMEKELLAGKEALRKWSHFLLGRRFDWRIDNSCLKWAHRVRSTKPRVSRWLAEISEFDINTILTPSTQMKVTDCLSRQFCEINAISVSKTELANLQESDERLRHVRNYVSNNRWPTNCDSEILFYKKQRGNLVFGRKGELLLSDHDLIKTIPPQCIIPEIITAYHDESGHPGEQKAIQELQRRYAWPNLHDDVKKYIQTCHECQTSKPNLKPRHPPLGESDTPSGPYMQMAFDLTGPLPMTNSDHKYILVGTDLFSKKLYATPLESKHAIVVSAKIQNFVYQNPKLPASILTDHGKEFYDITHFCEENGIRHVKSPPYHPQTNGAVERMNQSLKQRLFAKGREADWDQRLPRIVHDINCSNNSATKYSPFCVETGYSGRNLSDPVEHDDEILQDTRAIQNNVRQNIIREKQIRVEKNKNDSFIPFELGDLVLAKNHTQKFPRYLGPYRIATVRGHGYSYDLIHEETQQTAVRAVIDLKPYKQRLDNEQPDSSVEQSDHDDENQPVAQDDDYDFNINFHDLGNDVITLDSSDEQIGANSSSTSQQIQPEDVPLPDSNSDETSIPNNTMYATPSENSADDAESIESTELNLNDASNATIDNERDTNNVRTPSPPALKHDDTGKPSPRPPYPYKVKLYQMGDREITDLAEELHVTVSGSVSNKRNQLDDYFRTNRPKHSRTEKGHLIFNCSFDPDKPRKITELSTLELDAVIASFNLPKPSILINKKSLIKHVQKHFLKKYPRATLEDGSVIFGRPDEPNSKKP